MENIPLTVFIVTVITIMLGLWDWHINNITISHGYKVTDSPSVKRALCLTVQLGGYNAGN